MSNILNRARLERPVFEGLFWSLAALAVAALAVGLVRRIVWPAAIGLTGLIGLMYSGLIEPQLLTVKRYRLSLVKVPTVWITIAFLSDLHAGAFKGRGFYERMVKKTMRLKPDAVILGGDLVEDRPDPISALKSLIKLRAPLGSFFILGNHDYFDDPRAIRDKLLAWNFEDLTNAVRIIEKDGASLTLLGLDDAFLGAPDVQVLQATASPPPRLLVLHEPDGLLDVGADQVEAIIMGHTHGGQIRLPWIGPMLKLPQKAPQWLDRGLKKWRGIPLVISQGLGETNARVRLFCPPQIVVLEAGI